MAATLTIVAGHAAAADLSCLLQDAACLAECPDLAVQFKVDPAQFADPVSPLDPPRRQTTTVTMGDTTFTAQPIVMRGGIVGFDQSSGAEASRLMIVERDGTARLNMQPQNRTWIGNCTRQ